ncbi:M20/M25/M40 family metallo-hydrolase, partial [candidate division TA06 bacterium]|nr:M20/M25/M40 family metallo-hydrolase [candidate division TA06 bacterium]
MSTSPNAALKYAEEHRNRFLKELQDILSIPSISVEQERKLDVQRGAKWVADRLRKAGMERVKIFETAGHPVVFAEIKSSVPSAKTILIYGHYDVQPADPLEAWESDPFQSTIRGENLYARGATDMKGQVMASLCALEAVNRTGQLPVNVKFLLEGEEELGSPHLGEFLDTHHDLLACDFSLNPDAGMVGADSPTIVYGLRGLFGCRLRITGPSRDLHSGAFGGIVYNPIHALSELIAGMHDEEGRVKSLTPSNFVT